MQMFGPEIPWSDWKFNDSGERRPRLVQRGIRGRDPSSPTTIYMKGHDEPTIVSMPIEGSVRERLYMQLRRRTGPGYIPPPPPPPPPPPLSKQARRRKRVNERADAVAAANAVPGDFGLRLLFA
jgi:hypothetical protein